MLKLHVMVAPLTLIVVQLVIARLDRLIVAIMLLVTADIFPAILLLCASLLDRCVCVCVWSLPACVSVWYFESVDFSG